MRIVAIVVAVIVTLVTSRHASADNWYGWKLYPSDAAATTLLLIGDRTENGTMAALALPIYLFIPPIIHLTEGEDRRALHSLGLRAGVPLGVFLVTGAAAIRSDDGEGDVWIPTVASAVVAALIDSMLATTEDEQSAERAVFLQFSGSF